MSRREVHHSIKAVAHLVAAAPTTTQTPSSGVDLAGFNACEFVINIGTMANVSSPPSESWSFKLQHSDSASTDFDDVDDPNDVVVGSAASPVAAPSTGSPTFLVVNHADLDAAVYRIGYIGSKRYVRCVATAANTPGATPLAITAILALADLRPTAD